MSLELGATSTTVAGAMTPTPFAPMINHLGAAKFAKNDEFYTTWADIERETNAYLERTRLYELYHSHAYDAAKIDRGRQAS